MNNGRQNENEQNVSANEQNQVNIQTHEQRFIKKEDIKNTLAKDNVNTTQNSILNQLISLLFIIIIIILGYIFLSMKEKYFKQINIMNQTNSYLSETVNLMNQKINNLTETISIMNQSLKSNDQIISTISSLTNKNAESLEKIIITTKSLNGPGILSELKKREKTLFDKLFIPTISSRNPYDLIDPDAKGIFGTCDSGKTKFFIEFSLEKAIEINGFVIQSALKRFPKSFNIEIDGKLVCSVNNAIELNGPNCEMAINFRPTKAKRVRFVQTGPNWDEGSNFLQISKIELLSPQKEFEGGVFASLLNKNKYRNENVNGSNRKSGDDNFNKKSKNNENENKNNFYSKNNEYGEQNNNKNDYNYRSNIHTNKDDYKNNDFYNDNYNNNNDFNYNNNDYSSEDNFYENEKYRSSKVNGDDDFNDATDDFDFKDDKNAHNKNDEFGSFDNCINNNRFACSTVVQSSGVHITSHLFDLNSFHLLNSTKNVDTFNEPAQWFQIEFIKGKVIIDGFRLKRYSRHKMRNYKIVATDDKTKPVSEWTTLFDINENKYFENDELGVYEFERPSQPVTFVRLIQTGPTWSDTDYLSFYHFDLFGKYY